MALTAPKSIENRWDGASVADADELGALVYRSNLLAGDRSVVNFGGGNTSVKVRLPDHTGRETSVLWVKGSGSDLATIAAAGFAGLRLDEILPLRERDEMSDEQMVAYLARCQLDPAMPRPSIETLLHAFTPAPHVDHTHPDAIGAIVGAVDGERLAQECFGGDAIWIPYIRPGFALSKLVADALAENPAAKLVLLAKHGLVTWGATAAESYADTLDAINRAAAFGEAAYPSAAQQPHIAYALKSDLTGATQSISLSLDSQTFSNTSGKVATKQFIWPGTPPGARMQVKFGGAAFNWPAYDGVWAAFEFFGDSEEKSAPAGNVYRLEWTLRTGQSQRLVTTSTGQPVSVRFDLDMMGSPPIFRKGYFSGWGCVADVAR